MPEKAAKKTTPKKAAKKAALKIEIKKSTRQAHADAVALVIKALSI
jgi:hypothetical protein